MASLMYTVKTTYDDNNTQKTVTAKAYICHLVLEVLLIVTLPLGHLCHLILQLGCQQDICHLDNNLEE